MRQGDTHIRCTSSAPASTSASTSPQGQTLISCPSPFCFLVSHCWKSYSALYSRGYNPITHRMTKAVTVSCLLCTDFTANRAGVKAGREAQEGSVTTRPGLHRGTQSSTHTLLSAVQTGWGYSSSKCMHNRGKMLAR